MPCNEELLLYKRKKFKEILFSFVSNVVWFCSTCDFHSLTKDRKIQKGWNMQNLTFEQNTSLFDFSVLASYPRDYSMLYRTLLWRTRERRSSNGHDFGKFDFKTSIITLLNFMIFGKNDSESQLSFLNYKMEILIKPWQLWRAENQMTTQIWISLKLKKSHIVSFGSWYRSPWLFAWKIFAISWNQKPCFL